MKLTLGFSPCPNDTFIFDAMVHGKIDTEGLDFEVVMEDVESLNQRAFKQELHVTKLSYHAFAFLLDKYVLLDAGSALGQNCGPLLVADRPMSDEEINETTIAIPGKFTTANFLLSMAFPSAKNKVQIVFSEIENAILQKNVGAGLIIHENRFTYQQKGLQKLVDLGEFWEQSTGLPIPLGGIVAKRTLPYDVQLRVNRVMAKSVQFAFDHPKTSLDFVRMHAQEMDEEVMNSHIKLYVNEFTKNLGGEGRTAVGRMFDIARARGVAPYYTENIFLN